MSGVIAKVEEAHGFQKIPHAGRPIDVQGAVEPKELKVLHRDVTRRTPNGQEAPQQWEPKHSEEYSDHDVHPRASPTRLALVVALTKARNTVRAQLALVVWATP
eukprot:549670-Prymnesium_polylepis.1